MNITQTTHRLVSIEPTTALHSHASVTTRQAAISADSNQVSISTASLKLLEQQRGDHSSDMDMARVQTLRKAIAAGELHIDTGRIADGLISSACKLRQSTSA